MNIKRHLFVLGLLLSFTGRFAMAQEKSRIEKVLSSDREERILRINEMTVALNASSAHLLHFKAELANAREKASSLGSVRIAFRNTSAVVAAIGIISTVIYQSKGINPSKIILSGGYALSALASAISYFEHKTIRLSLEEITRLEASVSDLEQRVEKEKRNLAREIRLLCLSDGGMPEVCDRD